MAPYESIQLTREIEIFEPYSNTHYVSWKIRDAAYKEETGARWCVDDDFELSTDEFPV